MLDISKILQKVSEHGHYLYNKNGKIHCKGKVLNQEQKVFITQHKAEILPYLPLTTEEKQIPTPENTWKHINQLVCDFVYKTNAKAGSKEVRDFVYDMLKKYDYYEFEQPELEIMPAVVTSKPVYYNGAIYVDGVEQKRISPPNPNLPPYNNEDTKNLVSINADTKKVLAVK